MLQLQQTQRYSVLAAAPPPPPPRVLLTQGDAPAPPPKVLVTQGDASFVEYADGSKEWVQRTEDDWRATLRGYLNKAAMNNDATAEDPTTIVKRALEDWRAGHAVVLRGLLSPKAVAEVHACARDCIEKEWGTVRRRSVGLPDGSVFPQQSHARLSKHFRDQCPRAWAALWRGIAGVDWGTWPRFSGDAAVRNAFKQADYLLYQGGDSVGWHDHYGESLLFCVVLLSSDFEGGGFSYKPLDGGGAVDVMLAAGDVVVCPSEMEHRVGAVTGGTRASLNVDFWDVDAADDRRSDFDRY